MRLKAWTLRSSSMLIHWRRESRQQWTSRNHKPPTPIMDLTHTPYPATDPATLDASINECHQPSSTTSTGTVSNWPEHGHAHPPKPPTTKPITCLCARHLQQV